MDNRTDEMLVESAKYGDDAAYRELMRRYMGPIFGFAKQYAKTTEDAEDIAQDTFFKAWKHLKRFKPDKTFRPWLYAIARNTALDQIKKRRASSFSELDSQDSELQFVDTLEDNEPLPSEDYERSELAAELTDSMKGLHPDHRRVLDMHYREGLTFNEIAAIMKKPMNTVKSWHRRALERVKKALPHRKP